MNFTIHNGDNIDILKTLNDNSIDAIVTDPPYGIDFLGKSWDANTGALETYTECLRVLKPGGYILAFSAARTYHHLAITLEQAGFEIRDQLMWLYASGFPKAQDIGKAIQKRRGVEETIPYKENIPRVGGDGTTDAYDMCKEETICTSPEAQQWAGWKTALKPAHEPICMARKPFKGSTIDNVLEHGVGALNIDATRIDSEPRMVLTRKKGHNATLTFDGSKESDHKDTSDAYEMVEHNGRFPSNVLGEVEGYQKFFYCPKVSRKERHCGFEQLPDRLCGPGGEDWVKAQEHQGNNKKVDPLGHIVKKHATNGGKYMGTTTHPTDPKLQKHDPLGHIPAPFGDVKGAYVNGERMAKVADDTGYANLGNNHPTVKPVALMRYLIKLVTPPNSTVLDPFTGSGSTGMAAVELGHTFIGCELDPNYVEIAQTRIEAWNRKEEHEEIFESLFE